MASRNLSNLALILIFSLGSAAPALRAQETKAKPAQQISLPAPAHKGSMSLEEALAKRRSVREFANKPLSEQQLAQLLWAAQGANRPDGRRTAPSAGALYPLELYVATANGLFHYDVRQHVLERRAERDLRAAISQAALGQAALREAAAVFVIAAVYERTARKYGEERTPRYVHIEAGHAAQNLLLQAVSLGLGGVPVGAFRDDELHRALALPADQRPIYLIPIGYPR